MCSQVLVALLASDDSALHGCCHPWLQGSKADSVKDRSLHHSHPIASCLSVLNANTLPLSSPAVCCKAVGLTLSRVLWCILTPSSL
jgi:hypothetical protein